MEQSDHEPTALRWTIMANAIESNVVTLSEFIGSEVDAMLFTDHILKSMSYRNRLLTQNE